MDLIVARDPGVRASPERWRTATLAAALGAMFAAPAGADDLDVYRASIAAQQKPNVLFVLDYSASMNLDADGNDPAVSGKPAKIDILKQAVTSVVDANLDTIEFGIGSLYRGAPSGVRWPTVPMRDDANLLDPSIPAGTLSNRDVLLSQLDRFGAAGDTATVNALAEAAAYFRGAEVLHHNAPIDHLQRHRPDSWSTIDDVYRGGYPFASLPASYLPRDAFRNSGGDGSGYGFCADYSASGGPDNCAAFPAADLYDCETRAAGSYTNEGGENRYASHQFCKYRDYGRWDVPSYESPVQQCQANAVILVSDGVPTVLSETPTLVEAVDGPISSCEDLSTTTFAATNEWRGNCGIEIARNLATPGSLPDDPDGTVSVYTIGFALEGAGADYLKRLATAGGGSAELASDLSTLTSALNAQLGQIGRTTENFAELAVDVDRANFAHEERAYFGLFEPSRLNAWRGNLKGYFLSKQGLRGVDGALATETVDGVEVFRTDAQSFWSDQEDGNDTLLGGASEQLVAPAGATAAQVLAKAAARTLYTYTGARVRNGAVTLAGDPARALSITNPTLNPDLLGVDNEAQKNALIERLRAAPMGDPLHSQSVGLQYPGMKVVYSMTNQGLLHAFNATRPSGDAGSASTATDTDGGQELWAFMPKRLLANLPALFDNAAGGEHVYGLDGGITRWHDDDDNDGIVDPGERTLLVFGMRRGGNSYYALDVSDPNNPKLAWEIDPDVAGFERLAQSWSRPALVTGQSSAGTDGQERFLVFGGGYDAAELDGRDAARASRGNALFVVDGAGQQVAAIEGANGASGIRAMRYAIPATPTVIDSDGDGRADRLYAGDLGGQVWRVDFADMRNRSSYVTTRLATLGNASWQPFFYPPSVASTSLDGQRFLSVSLGSGARPDPMANDSENAFFMLRDVDVEPGKPARNFKTIKAADLFDATDNPIGSSDASKAATAKADMAVTRGWRIDLQKGEKSLSRLVSFQGKLLATTFEPSDTVPAGSCGPESIGRFYQMDIATGQPAHLGSDGVADGDGDTGDRIRGLNTQGIPSAPVILFPKGAEQIQVAVDKEIVNTIDQTLSRVFWHAR